MIDALPNPQLLRETTSTNALAMRAAQLGGAHGSCWIADAQTKGRGRRELGGSARTWFSPSGSNIYMSLLLRPNMQPQEAANLTLAAALGAVFAIARHTDVPVRVKWPNDLYVGEKKLAGILTEASFKEMKLDAVVIGLGLNVNLTQDDVPEDLQEKVTSLQMETAHPHDRLALALSLQHEITRVCAQVAEQGLSGILPQLRELDHTIDREVQWLREGQWRDGVARGIDDNGHLMIYDPQNNATARVQAGEVRFMMNKRRDKQP